MFSWALALLSVSMMNVPRGSEDGEPGRKLNHEVDQKRVKKGTGKEPEGVGSCHLCATTAAEQSSN